MTQEFTPTDIIALKKQINEDLDQVIKRFNEDYDSWTKRTKSEAIFRWIFDSSGNRKLIKETVNFPVFREPASDSDIKKAGDILSAALPAEVAK